MLRISTIAGISFAVTAATVGAVGHALGRQGSEFEQLLARHRRDISTPAGQAYEHAFTVHYTAGFGAVLGACIQQSGPPSSFEVIYIIDKDGRLTRAVAKAPTPLTACVIEAAQRDTFPKPPFSPFHEHVVQNFGP
jgi:hypothetical protein